MQDYKPQALEFIRSQNILSLSTVSPNKLPWIANFFYIANDDFKVFFSTYPNSRNCENIRLNPNVAISIYEPSATPVDVKGVQLWGEAHQADDKYFQKAFEEYNTKFMGATETSKTLQDKFSGEIGILYQVDPTEIHFRNTQLFTDKFIFSI